MGKIPYFRVFPLFGGIICQMILFSNFLSKFFNRKWQLLKKLSIEFYETQDLSSTHEKPKLLFYDYSCDFFFSSQSPRGTVDNKQLVSQHRRCGSKAPVKFSERCSDSGQVWVRLVWVRLGLDQVRLGLGQVRLGQVRFGLGLVVNKILFQD